MRVARWDGVLRLGGDLDDIETRLSGIDPVRQAVHNRVDRVSAEQQLRWCRPKHSFQAFWEVLYDEQHSH